MQTRLASQPITQVKTPLLALATFGTPWKAPAIQQLDKAVGGALKKLAREEGFKGNAGQTLTISTAGQVAATRVMIVGLGNRKANPSEQMTSFGFRVARRARAAGLTQLSLVAPSGEDLRPSDIVEWLSVGARLGIYRFDDHKTRAKAKKPPKQLSIVFSKEESSTRITDAIRSAAERGEVKASAVAFARDLINEPPNVLGPEELARRARKMARGSGLTVNVLGPKEIHRKGMRLLEAVNQGSHIPPRLIHLVHKPKSGKAKAKIALVGKGITFDSGGLSLKPSKGMFDMKGDMGGAAVVLGALQAAAGLDVPYEVHGIVPTTENMPGGNATRPGDVVAGMNGKTVEILNTDAEGRLILADALAYAENLKPAAIIDFATLTGACMVALGPYRAGVWGSDQKWTARYLDAARNVGEPVWRMPLAQELRDGLKSDVADMKNIGAPWGGAITAALFLNEFVDKAPWIHVDIAGPSFLEKPRSFHPKGGTGFGVLTLMNLLGS